MSSENQKIIDSAKEFINITESGDKGTENLNSELKEKINELSDLVRDVSKSNKEVFATFDEKYKNLEKKISESIETRINDSSFIENLAEQLDKYSKLKGFGQTESIVSDLNSIIAEDKSRMVKSE